jgi:hypothetical protein
MGIMFRYEFEISPVKPKEIDAVLDAVPFPVESSGHYKDKLIVWGESAMSGGILVEERHEEICQSLPGKKVVSRWRCTEFDTWDDVIGDEEESNAAGTNQG